MLNDGETAVKSSYNVWKGETATQKKKKNRENLQLPEKHAADDTNTKRKGKKKREGTLVHTYSRNNTRQKKGVWKP
jgi:hypothetical protein